MSERIRALDDVLRGLRSEDDSTQLRAIIASVEAMRDKAEAPSRDPDLRAAIREIEAAVVSGGALLYVHVGCVRKIVEVLRAALSTSEPSE